MRSRMRATVFVGFETRYSRQLIHPRTTAAASPTAHAIAVCNALFLFMVKDFSEIQYPWYDTAFFSHLIKEEELRWWKCFHPALY
jgi:hypothetical protein